ncbi:hypothetical protein [Ulvibacterium marinum]|uniref:Tetratricopeptide repeat protein n=1 Tax=Ulvibacterium marinum TaxID=2419782 RepID=A0A3B0CHW7_9FLAO|nr:hypothetical protein [Ulvibacterium marinum]RKN83396.1 hypothetical protein D7Z94_06120 [Ulvibacterium marinum]
MNVAEFTYLIQYPEKVVSPVQTKQLEDVLDEYPYFQAARALHLKGLKNLNSFKYNNALKVTAAYTSDRDILFDFITSRDFLQNNIADTISGKTTSLANTETISEEVLPSDNESIFLIEKSKDAPLPQNSGEADQILDPLLFESKNQKVAETSSEKKDNSKDGLQLGDPLPFTKREKYSFTEWLKLASLKTVKRSKNTSKGTRAKEIHFPVEEEVLKTKKFELIDKFIAENPKIVPRENPDSNIDIKSSVKIDKNELMTETLAKVYLEQKKYKKAVQAYKILSLKYPEKSGFFADRIKAIQKLQKKHS